MVDVEDLGNLASGTHGVGKRPPHGTLREFQFATALR
jgi:hypothetical protein